MEREIQLIEELARYEHERWARWQSYLHYLCIKHEDGTFTIPKEKVDRWNKQINTNYQDLSEEEKESDRVGARQILKILEKWEE